MAYLADGERQRSTCISLESIQLYVTKLFSIDLTVPIHTRPTYPNPSHSFEPNRSESTVASPFPSVSMLFNYISCPR